MRIGIVPNLNPEAGGVCQYSETVLQALNVWSEQGCEDRWVLLSTHGSQGAHSIPFNRETWEILPVVTAAPASLKERVLDGIRSVIGEGPHRDALRWLRKRFAGLRNGARPRSWTLPDPEVIEPRDDLRRCFLGARLDLLFYTYPTPISFESGVPYVIAVHDLQHRLQPEFPEVSADGEWEYREYQFRNGCRYATLIVADSEVGKEDILNLYGPYGVTEDRIKILPYLPATYLAKDVSETEKKRVRSAYGLPERYLFYPAQFWPHKNHARVVRALSLLKEQRQTSIPVLFCGSHSGEIREDAYRTVMSLRERLGLENEIRDLGYVPAQDMSALYSGAVALVMPTFFGPTNIPILEAWAFGCPVLTSDIRGVREQVADAAVLVDPRAVESIAEGIYRVWTDEGLRRGLSHAGRRQLSRYSADDFRRRLVEIVEEAKDRLRVRRAARPGRMICLHDIEDLLRGHPAIGGGRSVVFSARHPEATEEFIVVAEAPTGADPKAVLEIEQVVRRTLVAKLGMAPRAVYIKPPGWIVEGTSGKPARSATREKLLVEQAEAKGEERESLFELLNESVMIRSMEGAIDGWNRQAEQLYGWRREEAVGRVSHDLLRTQFPKPLQEIQAELVQRGKWQGKLVHTTRQGGRVVVASRWLLNPRSRTRPVVEINIPAG